MKDYKPWAARESGPMLILGLIILAIIALLDYLEIIDLAAGGGA